MKKLWCITITFRDPKRKMIVYPEDQVAGYQFMQNGFFFVQLQDKKEDVYKNKQGETVMDIKTETRFFNAGDIKAVAVEQIARFTGEVDILKFEKFKEHGINIIHNPISHTEVDKKKVSDEVENDKRVKIAKEKQLRLKNQKMN